MRASLSPEEASECSQADIDMMVSITGRLLNSELPDTVSSAMGLAKEIRLDARRSLGAPSRSAYAGDAEGQVIASGSNKVAAMQKAQEQRAS